MTSQKQHHYPIRMAWTGNTGTGTADYRGYQPAHEYSVPGKPPIPGSSDPAFRGDAARYNPEELLVMSLSSCHMLWYLHLCAEAGIVVTAYVDLCFVANSVNFPVRCEPRTQAPAPQAPTP